MKKKTEIQNLDITFYTVENNAKIKHNQMIKKNIISNRNNFDIRSSRGTMRHPCEIAKTKQSLQPEFFC